MGIEQSYPASYQKLNVDNIISRLKGGSCLTVISPSGYGKSYVLRYIANNKAYRRRHRSLSSLEFIYIDIHEMSTNLSSDFFGPNSQGIVNQNSEVEKLQVLLYTAILNKVQNFYKKKGTSFNIESKYSRENLLILLKEFFKLSNKLVYIILDSTEKLLTQNSSILGDFLHYIRDFNKGRIEYIFTLDSTSYLSNLSPNKDGKIAVLLAQQVYYMTLSEIQVFQFSNWKKPSIFTTLLTKYNKNITAKMRKINEISGGFFPYAKYLFNLENLDSRLPLSYELEMSSKELITSLTESQIIILKKIIQSQRIESSLDLNFLIETGLVRFVNGRLHIFSRIFDEFLKKSIHFNEI